MSRTHRKVTKIDKKVTTAMEVGDKEVLLHAAFTAAVKAAYTAGNMSAMRLDEIVSAVETALHARKGNQPLPTWDTAAVDAALTYLADKGLITLPSMELAGVA